MGLFIAFDGPNGVDKTTLISEIEKKLEKCKIQLYKTSEPTKTELGEFVRKISESISKEALACLVAADRFNHIDEVILPQLENNNVILCDRYIASSLVLQEIDGVKEKLILDLHDDMIMPDLYFILVAEPETINKRLSERKELTRFEKKQDIAYLEVMGYYHAAEVLKKKNVNIVIVDTNRPIDECVEVMINLILKLAKKKGVIND